MSRRRVEAALHAGRKIAKVPLLGEVKELHEYRVVTEKYGVLSVQYSHEGNAIVLGYADGANEILSADTGQLLRVVKHHKINSFGTLAIRFKPKDLDVFYTGGADGTVRACRVADANSATIVVEEGNEIFCLDFDLHGNTFATAGKDRSVRLYDVISNQLVKEYEGYGVLSAEHTLVGHEKRVFALRFHPLHNSVFITGGWDNHLKVWDTRTEHGVMRNIGDAHISGDGLDIKDNLVLTGSWVKHHALQLWDFRQGALLKSVPLAHAQQGEYLYSAQFLSAETAIAGGSGTNSAQLLSLINGTLIGEVSLQHPVQAVDSTDGGRSFTVAGGGNIVKIASYC